MEKRGRLYIDNDNLVWDFKTENAFTMKVSDILAVGQLTTEGNPILDDYFLVIIDKTKKYYAIPFYEDDASETYKKLSEILNFKRDIGLANSTVFNSIGLYPDKIKGLPLFYVNENDDIELKRQILELLN